MRCAGCSGIIGKTLKKLPGINSASVNFATEKAVVSYDPAKVSLPKINQAVRELGYLLVEPKSSAAEAVDPKKVYFSFLAAALVFLLMLWNIAAKATIVIPAIPIPEPSLNIIMFLLATTTLFWAGKPFLAGITRFFSRRAANMDTLVGIGTFSAYIYSSFILFFLSATTSLGLPEHTYFDITIVVIGFVTFGKYLEAHSKMKTGEAIKKLIGLQVKTALVVRNNQQIEIPVSEVVVKDFLLIKAGAKIPVDGIIVKGRTSVDESMVTGEPIPNDKKPGDTVIGGTVNKQGAVTIRATQVGANTLLSQIIELVEKAQNSKARIQSVADRVSAVFAPVVLLIAVTAFVLWLSVGSYYLGFSAALSFALLSFVGVLVIACPCALGLATPTAIIVSVGKGAQNGILIKDAQSLEKLNQVNTIVFDKTGTITSGVPTVVSYFSLDGKYSDVEILKLAASIESFSQHPLATAITNKAKELSLDSLRVSGFRETEGVGVEGVIRGSHIVVRKHYQKDRPIPPVTRLEEEGNTVVIIQIADKIVGVLAISDPIKKNVRATVAEIHRLGVKTVMLTGDNEKAAEHIAKSAGIENVKAEVTPQDKAAIIRTLQSEGNIVAMVGDGINDAPALTQADVGIAMATGTDIAIESSDISLLHGDLSKILQAVRLSRLTIRTVKQNLFWAFIYNIIGIPLAAGIFYPLWGVFLNPIFAGLAMALSSVSVVSNSLLLKKVKL